MGGPTSDNSALTSGPVSSSHLVRPQHIDVTIGIPEENIINTSAAVENRQEDYFTPEKNKEWPKGKNMNSLHPDYMKEKGFRLRPDGLFEITKDNRWSWGRKMANFCEDVIKEEKSITDKKRVIQSFPLNRFSENDRTRLDNFVQNEAIKNKTNKTAMNSEPNRELLRNLRN